MSGSETSQATRYFATAQYDKNLKNFVNFLLCCHCEPCKSEESIFKFKHSLPFLDT
ncbi:hypothetical protein [Campylobacter troglodytis]|uniref:hypothetical protein n=1 Tax=Campylobacter troglodytis TaxID=654363 RepID=UPI00163D171C|nr:hypothetical protein [Campylobacter troglodytis]